MTRVNFVSDDGFTVQASTDKYGPRSTKTRVFVTVKDDEIPMERPPFGSSRGDGSDEDTLWAQYNRLELKAMRDKAVAVVQGLGVEKPQLSFTRYAGCSMCPCSPGFVLVDKIQYGVLWIE